MKKSALWLLVAAALVTLAMPYGASASEPQQITVLHRETTWVAIRGGVNAPEKRAVGKKDGKIRLNM